MNGSSPPRVTSSIAAMRGFVTLIRRRNGTPPMAVLAKLKCHRTQGLGGRRFTPAARISFS